MGPRSEPEDEAQRLVDGTQLDGVETPCGAAEALRIDDRRLLDENPRVASADGDPRPEARREGARGRRGDQRRRKPEKLVGLHDHGVAGAALLVAPRVSRSRQAKDLAANHSTHRAWCQLGQLLAHDPHLLPIVLVGCQPPHLLAERRTSAPPVSGLAKRSANGLRIGQRAGANYLERGDGRIVETNME